MQSKVFDSLLEPTFVIDTDLKVQYCNEPAALICDSSVRKIIRQKPALNEFLKFEEPILAFSDLKSIDDPTPYQEIGFETSTGRRGKVQLTVQAFENQQWLVYFRDVTLEETLQKKYRGELEQKESVILDLQKARDELKHYSENLEKMVEERTREVLALNQTMRALLDSLTQGFFIFDSQGNCLPVFSKSCLQTLEADPSGKTVWEVLKLPEKAVPGFKRWMPTLFMEMLPFKDLADLGPQSFPHSLGRNIKLEYYPVRNSENKVTAVVVVSTDITDLVQAQKEAEQEKAQSKMLISLIKNKTAASAFLRESQEMLAELQTEIKSQKPSYENLFRLLHTLKGAMGSFHVQDLFHLCHETENELASWNEQFEASAKAHVFARLEEKSKQLFAGFETFLEENAELLDFNKQDSKDRIVEFSAKHLLEVLKSENLSDGQFQLLAERLLSVPVASYFKHYEEVSRQVAEQEGKVLREFSIQGGDLQVLPETLEALFGSFVHAYRNAVDHGIESPEERISLGKPEGGSITTRFNKISRGSEAWMQIEVIDDGGGIKPEKIREKLTHNGRDVSAESDHEVIQHVFDSSFSTREVVTQTSGRGVGMDAIQTEAHALGGKAEVFSQGGVCSKLVVVVPVPQFKGSEKQSQKAA
jgi:two-component system chemotaxis sensor kinase CheA